MLRALLSPFRSLANSVGILIRQLAKITSASLRGDWEGAGGHARILYLSTHEDLLKALVALQRRLPFWRKPAHDIDRILIVKLDRIGDMVTTMPVLDALNELFPRARLDIVGHPVPLSMLDGDPRIAEAIPYRSWLYHPLPLLPPGPKSWLLILKLLFRRYPLVVYLRGSVPMLVLGLTSRLAATRYVWAEPTIERYMKAVRSVCGPVGDFEPRLHVNPEYAEFAKKLVRGSEDETGPCVTIHAAASSAVKAWPAERFAALADELQGRFGCRVHFLGSPSDRPVMEKIRGLSRRAHAYHWSLRLPQSAAVIAESDVFVGNDSGLSHIAAAVSTPAVVLWGPANLSMARPKATDENCIILYHDLPCRDACVEFRCHNPNPFECLMRTQVQDVVDAVERLLQDRVKRPLAVLDLANA
jgi:heptosyltransferase-2/heptosyltransferase-3